MHALGYRADMLGPGPTATSDDLRSGFDPRECVVRKLVGREVVRVAAGRSTCIERSPEVRPEIRPEIRPEVRPEVRIGAERHAGIAQCAQAVSAGYGIPAKAFRNSSCHTSSTVSIRWTTRTHASTRAPALGWPW